MKLNLELKGIQHFFISFYATKINIFYIYSETFYFLQRILFFHFIRYPSIQFGSAEFPSFFARAAQSGGLFYREEV